MNWSIKICLRGVFLCLYTSVGWTAALGSNRLETMVKMRRRGRLEAVTRRWMTSGPHLGWPAPHGRPVGLAQSQVAFSFALVSSGTIPSILAEFRRDLIWFLDSYSSLTVSNSVPGKSLFTKAVEIVMLVHKTFAWWRFRCLLFQSVFIGDSVVGTPIIVNDISVSIVSTSSLQWCALIHRLRCFYM
jgi:hypothetical protein